MPKSNQGSIMLTSSDAVSRVNFLYQAAQLTMRLNPDRPVVSSRIGSVLARFAHRQQVRLHRSAKRGLCRRCHVALVPGISCTLRTRSRPQRCQVLRCLVCGAVRRRPCPRPRSTAASGNVSSRGQAAEEGSEGIIADVLVEVSEDITAGAAVEVSEDIAAGAAVEVSEDIAAGAAVEVSEDIAAGAAVEVSEENTIGANVSSGECLADVSKAICSVSVEDIL